MRDLEDLLKFVVTNADGAQFAALGSADGLLVEQYPASGQDLSAYTAEITNVLNALARLNTTGLEAGTFKEVMASGERLVSFTRRLNDELFLMVIMDPSGNLGKARLYSDQVAAELLEIFA